MSDDGRYVTYYSGASNIVPDDTNGVQDVFWLDRESGETRRVSVASGGPQANGHSQAPVISGNGRWVVFRSFASNLVPEVSAPHNLQIYRHDTSTGITDLVSSTSTGDPGTGSSHGTACAPCLGVSDDGRYVAFSTQASNLFGATWSQAARKDMETGAVELLTGIPANNNVDTGDMSPSGGRVTFSMTASSLNGSLTRQVWMWRATTATPTLVSRSPAGQIGDAASFSPTFDSTGDRIFFVSSAENLVSGSPKFVRSVYRYNVGSATVGLAFADFGGFLVSTNGDLMPFTTGDSQVAIRDLQTGETAPVSLSPDGSPGDAGSFSPLVSGNGSTIIFLSRADNLLDGLGDPADTLHYFAAEAPFFPDDGDTLLAPDPWLRSIDNDHTWRSNRRPAFPSGDTGGNANFPIWESCVLRDAVFRTLFSDWETPELDPTNPINFPPTATRYPRTLTIPQLRSRSRRRPGSSTTARRSTSAL